MKQINFVFALLFITLSFVTNAQETMNEGFVKFELTDIIADDPAMASQLNMIKGSTQDIYFDKNQTLTKVSMMGGMMETTTLMDINSKEGVLLFNMEMLGQKIKVDLDAPEVTDTSTVEMDYTYEYFEDDKKVIQGYEVYRMEVNSDQMEGMEMYAYITEKIQSSTTPLTGVDAEGVRGFPLEYVMSAPGFKMVYKAIEVGKKLDSSIFTLDTTGYEEKTMEEFQKSMGQFGGMGF